MKATRNETWYACLILAILMAAGTAGATGDPYALPSTKGNIEPCRRAALALHPGLVEKFQVIHRDQGFHFHFAIRESDNSAWAVVCDGLTGQIISTERTEEPSLPLSGQ